MALLSLEEARAFVTTHCPPLPATDVALSDALGCVLAEDVISTEAVPPFANTAMDGFAVRSADVANVPCDLTVIGTLAAGAEPTSAHRVGAGESVRIMTGAAMPDGADAIVPVENIDRSCTTETSVRILVPAESGAAVRPAGEDIAVGQLVFSAGTVLSAGHVGVLASIGLSSIRAFRRIKVGVLSTGDELISPPAPLRVGQIRDSNRHTLVALARQANCEVVDLGLARDTAEEIESKVLRAISECDALVTSGGVSMGDFDYVKVVLDRLSNGGLQSNDGASEPMRWMQIAIKPAKPLAFGVIGGKPVFGLPGNPVSCMVSFELFARAGLRRMMGHGEQTWARPSVKAIVDETLKRSTDGKVHFARVTAAFASDGRVHVASSGGQASNLLRAMALADALAILPNGESIPAGAEVDVLLLDNPS
jgi:molybdopterin molybdotransferase